MATCFSPRADKSNVTDPQTQQGVMTSPPESKDLCACTGAFVVQQSLSLTHTLNPICLDRDPNPLSPRPRRRADSNPPYLCINSQSLRGGPSLSLSLCLSASPYIYIHTQCDVCFISHLICLLIRGPGPFKPGF